MGSDSHEAINQFKALMEQVDGPLKRAFENVHQGYEIETLERLLKAVDGDVMKAYLRLLHSLQWRLQLGIDDILTKPGLVTNFYRRHRDEQLKALSGYTKEGLPVFAIDVALSTFYKVSIHKYVQSHILINEYRDRVILPETTIRIGRYIDKCVKVLDMSVLNISALNQIKLLSTIFSVDELNYPEKTVTYYIVNAPYMLSACWKLVKPLLQERTKLKVQVLQGGGSEELSEIMDNCPFPHYFQRDLSGFLESGNMMNLTGDSHQETTLLSLNGYYIPTLVATTIHDGLVEPLQNLWDQYYPRVAFVEEDVVMPPSALNFIITVLLALAGIKSQNQSDFPFITHPHHVSISVASLVVYGLCCTSELIASGLDRNSVFAVIARWGKLFSLCVLAISLACLFLC